MHTSGDTICTVPKLKSHVRHRISVVGVLSLGTHYHHSVK